MNINSIFVKIVLSKEERATAVRAEAVIVVEIAAVGTVAVEAQAEETVVANEVLMVMKLVKKNLFEKSQVLNLAGSPVPSPIVVLVPAVEKRKPVTKAKLHLLKKGRISCF